MTPWDQGEVQRPLRDLIDSRELDLPKQGRALVPGCGRVSSILSHVAQTHIVLIRDTT